MDLSLDRRAPWGLVVGWAVLPFAAGPLLGEALARHSEPVALQGAVLLWTGWTVVLVATLVAHPISLTIIRIGAPAALAAAIVASLDAGVIAHALAWCVIVNVTAFAPQVGRHHVNGPAYANERRHLLRMPGALWLGPLVIAWALSVIVPAAGFGLTAARVPIGLVLLIGGMAAAPFLCRAMHRLSRRWLVFVPAGVVVHDHLALAEPVLFLRASVDSIAAAPADTDAVDLTLAAPGLAVQISLTEETALGRVVRGRSYGDEVSAMAVLVTPTRPGAVLRDAASRRLRVTT